MHQTTRMFESHADEERMRCFLVRRTEGTDEMICGVVRHARQRIVVHIKMAVGSEVIAHSLQAKENLPALGMGSARTARYRIREAHLQPVDMVECTFQCEIEATRIDGTRQREHAASQIVIGAMYGRQKQGFDVE